MRCSAFGQTLSSYVRQRKMKFLVAAMLMVVLMTIVGGGLAVAGLVQPPPGALQAEEKQLQLVHVIFRHGQRTPADTYPNDVYSNHTFYPFGWGQLTNVGRQNQYKLGEFLRQRYDGFLGKLYSTSSVYAQSTHPDRAHMSCALTLAGLWPPQGTDLDWNPKLNWSPVPIRSQPLEEDTLLLARKNCPRYFEELENVFKSEEVQKILDENQALFQELTDITGMTIKNPDDVQSLYSTLKAEKDFGLELPKWTEKYYPDKLLPLTESSFILNANNQELKRLKGGPLLKKVISDWSAKSHGVLSPKDRKIFVYAGHDSTVSNLVLALGAWEPQVPGYGITVMMELYKDTVTDEYGVEIYLRNSTEVEPTKLTIPGCSDHCPLEKFIELTKDVVPENWSVECKAKNPDYVAPAPGGP